MGDLEKKFPASACRKKKIACSTNVIESLREKREKYPAHQIARKKILMTRNNQPPQELNGRPLMSIFFSLFCDWSILLGLVDNPMRDDLEIV